MTFLRQLFPLHLTAGACADLLWWKIFLQDWNGRSFPPATPSIEVTHQMHQAHLDVVPSRSITGGFSLSGQRAGEQPALQQRS